MPYFTVLPALLLLLATSEGLSLRPPLTFSTVRHDLNATNVSIDFLTAHTQVNERDDLELSCVVAIRDESQIVVEWIFLSAENDGASPEEALVIARNGVVVSNRSGFLQRVSANVRRRWDAVTDFNDEEHYLLVTKVQLSDQGVYACQVKGTDDSLLASKHSLITVIPLHTVHSATLQSSPLTTDEDQSADIDPLLSDRPTLGPITERFVVATRGTNVVLECRDADGNWVYWRKHGDPSLKATGRELRLFRVDRWDSGLYYCSTNSSFSREHNVTLRVDQAPRATATKYEGPAGRARQALGYPAILTCKVEAVPVPRISWYKVTNRHILNSSSEPSGHHHPLVTQKQKLHSGDRFSISIHGFKDGFVESSLHIPSVQQEHFGVYLCEATNALGEDSVEIRLEETMQPVDFTKILSENGGAKTGQNQRISALIFCIVFVTHRLL